MPKISRFFIKTGLLYFLLALLLRVTIDALELLPTFVLLPLFWHALMLGWITQIIMGVSIWMFPGRSRDEGFKAQKLPWLTYLGLNIGLTVRMVAEPAIAISAFGLWPALLVISAVLQLTAVICYILEMWPRIQSKKQRIKNRKKKR